MLYLLFVLYLLLIVPVTNFPIENAVQSIFTTLELAVGSKTYECRILSWHHLHFQGSWSNHHKCLPSISAAFQCKEFEFNCTNKKCIQESWVCDGDDDCGDMSDEVNCDVRENKCRDSEFQCKTLDRMCIHMSWKCDGDFDCEDQSDEKHCKFVFIF